MSEKLNVFVAGAFAGTATSMQEANTMARLVANRMGRVGSVDILITDEHNNRRQGGSIYVT